MKLSIALLVSLVFTISNWCSGQAPVVKITYATNKERRGVFRLTYENLSNDSVVFWIQNWRMNLIENENQRLNGFPFTGGPLNFFILINDSLDLNKQISDVEYSSTSVGSIETPCLKMLGPKSSFKVEIVTREKEVTNFMKTKNMAAYLMFSFAKWDTVKVIPNARYFLYKPSEIIIDRLPVIKNSDKNVSSFVFDFAPRRKEKLYYRDFKSIFGTYVTTKLKID